MTDVTLPEPLALEALPSVLDVAECASLLRVDPKTVRRMLKDGELRGARCGRHFRIPRVHVEQLLGLAPRPGGTTLSLPTRAPAIGRPGRPRRKRRASVVVTPQDA